MEEPARLREFYQQSPGGWAHKLSAGPDRQSGALLDHTEMETRLAEISSPKAFSTKLNVHSLLHGIQGNITEFEKSRVAFLKRFYFERGR